MVTKAKYQNLRKEIQCEVWLNGKTSKGVKDFKYL